MWLQLIKEWLLAQDWATSICTSSKDNYIDFKVRNHYMIIAIYDMTIVISSTLVSQHKYIACDGDLHDPSYDPQPVLDMIKRKLV